MHFTQYPWPLPFVAILLALGLNALQGAEQSPATAQPAATLRADQPLDLFLLIGQSNMAGRGVPEAEDQTPHPRVWTLTSANEWAPARDPLHFDKPKVAGVGPGLSFGKALADRNADVHIGLIPCAVGGTSIDQWKKGGQIYQATMKRASIAMVHGRLKAILWHQGEAEDDAALIAAYPAKLAQLIADLRQDLGAPELPVIVAELGAFRSNAVPFNKMIAQVPRDISKTACVTAADLAGHAGHFVAASQRQLGRRYATAYIELTENK